MKKLLLLGTMLPLFCFSQKKNSGFGQLAGSFYITKKLGGSGGGSFIVGNYVGSSSSIGAGLDVIKFDNIKTIVPIIYADLRGYFGKGYSKPVPYVTVTPGYNLYNYSNVKGGFFFGAGLGCLLHSGKKTAPYISVLYNKIPFSTRILNKTITTSYDIAKLSVGLKF